MASNKITIDIDTGTLHSAIREFLQDYADETGVAIQSVDVSWIESLGMDGKSRFDIHGIAIGTKS